MKHLPPGTLATRELKLGVFVGGQFPNIVMVEFIEGTC
jgi:hypothetical protein